ncbi:MAG: hypothetical protein VXZ47_06010 [Candidatus Thermoplasmatota archaeon]|nr:hypothetical protein [Candidatus Thermoplasmatota archaeon]
MRRSQSTLLTTLAVVISLLFMSQFPTISPVSNIHPDDTDQERPPTTDSDGDGIPDVHENLFAEWVNGTAVDGRGYSMEGLDKDDASDALLDNDQDGLNATEEYCWPYPAECTDPGFLRGLTGVVDGEGIRSYLDPRKSDTDGDGMPDGYEAYMCLRIGGFDVFAQRYQCNDFDPLNASDATKDPDMDGFDVNRDGIMNQNEWYTSSEEYIHGAPANHTTELDGLWCTATLPEGALLTNWPYIPTGVNATFQNLLPACTNSESPVGEDLWLGTDPLLKDSDRYNWDGFSVRSLFPSFGDGIPDGWEVHFGLDPLNRSSALLDEDFDGWDENYDGILSPDVSRTDTALAIGEQLSNIEEYKVYYDEGNDVIAGLKSVEFDTDSSTLFNFPISFAVTEEELSIMHHDVRSLNVVDSTIYATTKYGVTIIDYSAQSNIDYWMPQGVILQDAELLFDSDDNLYSIAVASNFGLGVGRILSDGSLEDAKDWDWSQTGALLEIEELEVNSPNNQLIGLGISGTGNVFEVSSSGLIEEVNTVSTAITNQLATGNATVTDIEHGLANGNLTLFIATDRGLLISETNSGRDGDIAEWRFYFTQEDTGIFASINELRTLPVGSDENPAEIRDIHLDGPTPSNPQVLWFGTPSGLHQMRLIDNVITHSGLLENPGSEEISTRDINSIRSIHTTGDQIILGSSAGTWVVSGDYSNVYEIDEQEIIPGYITQITTIGDSENMTIFGAAAPGKYSNLELMNPKSNDSDSDGIPDGWEIGNGLDPTDPWDALLDFDFDGLDLDQSGDGIYERLWTNLDEFRYVERTEEGYNSTNPNAGDTDGDGLSDGAEYFGFFYESTNLWCYYNVQLEYICDSQIGAAANQTYLQSGIADVGTDPTNHDSDGDGMPDGWEIENRRWVGSTFTGGNNWSLDPNRAEDATWDADGDGLQNLCEYQWSQLKYQAMEGLLLESHGENISGAENWTESDPNNIDSDGDTLPDGWEASYSCSWAPSRAGINPLNGSDALNNPDNDGFDIDRDGILQINEAFVNYLEYHLRDDLFDTENPVDFDNLPFGLTTDLFDNVGQNGYPEASYSQRAAGSYLASQNPLDEGASDPLDSDSDEDGMPDGWEIWFSRWDVLQDEWTLNPLQPADRWQDADDDGMTNWEEYNAIDPLLTETDANRSSPKWFVTTVGSAYTFQAWAGIQTDLSFGSFVNETQRNLTGITGDPNNVDTDGDGIIDGVELLFTTWNSSTQTWTLNPLTPGDGLFDSDEDGLVDLQEFALVNSNPDNGIEHPTDAPLLHIDGDLLQPTEKAQRMFNMLISKETRGKRLLNDFNDWQNGEPANAFISILMGITDPTNPDTDGDGMYDGFEYWFAEWDLENNLWSINPLIDGDVLLDTDGDSFDCDGDGNISLEERFSNLREWESRTWGKYSERNTIPQEVGILSFGDDAINAYIEELGYSYIDATRALYDDFASKSPESADRMQRINSYDENNFNRTLIGVADPTSTDSDGDSIPDGWEYCYAIYGMPDVTTQNHWAANPINPHDVNYDGDSDGWYDRNSLDIPATQGIWEDRNFIESGTIIQPGPGSLPFTNLMEWNNNTRPDLNDTDADSVTYITQVINGQVVAHQIDYNLSDGREVFKYGINPNDNDTDGDMLPDWYEYKMAWNESNDNFSSYLQIKVVWIDSLTGGECDTNTVSCLPLSAESGVLSRPELEFTWFTLDPADPVDANYDPDNDGNYDCSGAGCSYEPYTNFQEFYMITDEDLTSPNAVRLAPLVYQGSPVEEWWQFRGYTLGLGEPSEASTNYLKMDKQSSTDFRYVLIIDDNDDEFLTLNPDDDQILLSGAQTDLWEIYYASSPQTAPVMAVGEHELGWYMMDFDDDHLAEGSSPISWDTDGDWIVDWFEVNDDEEDGLRGDSSPIRYDSRQTG